MILPTVTLHNVLKWEPCYSRERLVALASGRERVDAIEILALPIPAADRLWAVLRPELLPPGVATQFAAVCATRAAASHAICAASAAANLADAAAATRATRAARAADRATDEAHLTQTETRAAYYASTAASAAAADVTHCAAGGGAYAAECERQTEHLRELLAAR